MDMILTDRKRRR